MFFYCDESLKRLAVHSVFTEVLNCKLLLAQAAGIKHLYFSWRDEIRMASNGRTLRYGEELNFCYGIIKIIKISLERASEYAIRNEGHLSSLD
jgi:hypothetical protein